jgi:hypothetical protein
MIHDYQLSLGLAVGLMLAAHGSVQAQSIYVPGHRAGDRIFLEPNQRTSAEANASSSWAAPTPQVAPDAHRSSGFGYAPYESRYTTIYKTPLYHAPVYIQLGYPTHGHPTHGHPTHGQPTHGQPIYGRPSHSQPIYSRPSHRQTNPIYSVPTVRLQNQPILPKRSDPSIIVYPTVVPTPVYRSPIYGYPAYRRYGIPR